MGAMTSPQPEMDTSPEPSHMASPTRSTVRHSLLDIWVASHSPNEAEAVASALRNTGHRVRVTFISRPKELREAIEQGRPDVLLCAVDTEGLDIRQCGSALGQAGIHAPIVGIGDDVAPSTVAAAIRDGARDLIPRGAIAQLNAVIDRELKVARQWHELQRAKRESSEAEKRFESFINGTSDPMAYIVEGIHADVNPAYASLLGYEVPAELEGLPFMDMVAPSHRDPVKRYLRAFDQGKLEPTPLPVVLRRADGSTFETQILGAKTRRDGDECLQVLIPATKQDAGDPHAEAELEEKLNVTQARLEGLQKELQTKVEREKTLQSAFAKLKQENQQLLTQTQQARSTQGRDPLTGLWHLQHFTEVLERRFAAPPTDAVTAIGVVELCDLEELPVQIGFETVNRFIGGYGEVLASALPDNALLARLSDNRLVLYLEDANINAAQSVAESALATASETILESGPHSRALGGNMGIREINPELSLDLLIANACDAAASANADGVPSRIYVPPTPTGADAGNDAWLARIRHALENDLFQLIYQPIAALDGGASDRYEVRLRMLDEGKNEVMPAEFIPAAEHGGLMGHLDRWVINRTLEVIKERGEQNKASTFFAKLSAQSVVDPGFISWLEPRVTALPGEQTRLLLEIEEHVLEGHIKVAKTLIQELRKIGCGFVIEGAGRSGRADQLIEFLAPDYVKFDDELINHLPERPEQQEQLKHLISKCNEKQILMIAGRVEDANCLAVLWQLGVNYIQGNYVQEPEVVLSSDADN
ncbi:MAG: EAL domain-containing protein [Pseudomonadota bacterium]|nr:EAL domain-containing protein [Pseudomonadota bacterium]